MSRVFDHVGERLPDSQPDYGFDRKSLIETFSENLLRRLRALNQCVVDTGEAFEGGIFYWHEAQDFLDARPVTDLASARRNYWRAVRFKSSILEIGVNAGHSALLALSSNPELVYYGVDIDYHAYTARCARYLAAEFPGRFVYLPGDSREVLPALAAQRPRRRFDLFHVDGGHTAEICRTDISNCLRLAPYEPGAHLLLDDINATWIFDVYCEYVARGYLVSETFFGDWEDVNRNVLSRIIPSRR